MAVVVGGPDRGLEPSDIVAGAEQMEARCFSIGA
jgi:hypothetical protein